MKIILYWLATRPSHGSTRVFSPMIDNSLQFIRITRVPLSMIKVRTTLEIRRALQAYCTDKYLAILSGQVSRSECQVDVSKIKLGILILPKE